MPEGMHIEIWSMFEEKKRNPECYDHYRGCFYCLRVTVDPGEGLYPCRYESPFDQPDQLPEVLRVAGEQMQKHLDRERRRRDERNADSH